MATQKQYELLATTQKSLLDQVKRENHKRKQAYQSSKLPSVGMYDFKAYMDLQSSLPVQVSTEYRSRATAVGIVDGIASLAMSRNQIGDKVRMQASLKQTAEHPSGHTDHALRPVTRAHMHHVLVAKEDNQPDLRSPDPVGPAHFSLKRMSAYEDPAQEAQRVKERNATMLHEVAEESDVISPLSSRVPLKYQGVHRSATQVIRNTPISQDASQGEDSFYTWAKGEHSMLLDQLTLKDTRLTGRISKAIFLSVVCSSNPPLDDASIALKVTDATVDYAHVLKNWKIAGTRLDNLKRSSVNSEVATHMPEFAEKCKAQGYQIRFDHLHSVRKDIKKLSSKVRKTRAYMATKQLNSVLAGLNIEEISSNGKVSAAHLKEACSTYSPMKQTPRPQTTTWIGGTGCSLPSLTGTGKLPPRPGSK